MNVKELFAKIGEGNFPLAAFKCEDCQGVAFAGGDGDVLFDVPLIPVADEDMTPGDIRLDDHNADCIALIVHCVNKFAEVIIPRADIPFDPTRGFDSPHAAIEYACSFGGSYEEKQQRVLLIVAFNVDQSEFGFASEVVRELERMRHTGDARESAARH